MFAEGDKVDCDLKQADGKEHVHPGIVLQSAGDKKYKVYTMGVVMLLNEDELSARN